MSGSRDSVPQWVLWSAVTVLAVWLLYTLRGVLAPVFFAFLIAYMLDPVVDRLEERGLLRGGAIAILLGVAFVVVGVLVVVVAPIVFHDISSFIRGLPVTLARLRAQWEPVLAEYGITVPTSVQQALQQFHVDAQEVVTKGLTPVSAVVGSILGGTASFLGAAIGALVVPVFAFYLLYDFDRLVAKAGTFVPPRLQPDVFSFFRDVDAVLGQFFRGQFTVMAILAFLYGAVYAVIGVPLAVPIGIVAGLVSFIPYFGGALALGLALLMSVLDWEGFGQILWICVGYALVQTAEGFFITPKIMGDKIGLSAIAVLFALLVGGELLGFTGILLAVPAAAVVKIVLERTNQRYRQSLFYRGAE